jgi:hypothetical protein
MIFIRISVAKVPVLDLAQAKEVAAVAVVISLALVPAVAVSARIVATRNQI